MCLWEWCNALLALLQLQQQHSSVLSRSPDGRPAGALLPHCQRRLGRVTGARQPGACSSLSRLSPPFRHHFVNNGVHTWCNCVTLGRHRILCGRHAAAPATRARGCYLERLQRPRLLLSAIAPQSCLFRIDIYSLFTTFPDPDTQASTRRTLPCVSTARSLPWRSPSRPHRCLTLPRTETFSLLRPRGAHVQVWGLGLGLGRGRGRGLACAATPGRCFRRSATKAMTTPRPRGRRQRRGRRSRTRIATPASAPLSPRTARLPSLLEVSGEGARRGWGEEREGGRDVRGKGEGERGCEGDLPVNGSRKERDVGE